MHMKTNQTEILNRKIYVWEMQKVVASIDTKVVLYIKEKFGLSDSAYQRDDYDMSSVTIYLPA